MNGNPIRIAAGKNPMWSIDAREESLRADGITLRCSKSGAMWLTDIDGLDEDIFGIGPSPVTSLERLHFELDFIDDRHGSIAPELRRKLKALLPMVETLRDAWNN